MNRDVALAKLSTIERCLGRVREVVAGDPARVREIDVQDLAVLNLQRAIQAALDLAAHVIRVRRLGLPDSLKDHFRILESADIIPRALGAQLQSMVGFRNIAVHDYQKVDVAVLESIVRDHLVDLERFADSVKRLLQD